MIRRDMKYLFCLCLLSIAGIAYSDIAQAASLYECGLFDLPGVFFEPPTKIITVEADDPNQAVRRAVEIGRQEDHLVGYAICHPIAGPN